MSAFFVSSSGAVSGVGPGWAGCVACGDVVPSISSCSGLCASCSPSSRAPRSPLAPSPGWLAGRAAAGGGVLAVIRLSARSFSGSVGVVLFASAAQAASFARSLATVLGVSLVVRGRSVSVPVFLGGEPC